MHGALKLVVLLPAGLLLSVAGCAHAPDTRGTDAQLALDESYVQEPVFGSRVLLQQAGMENRQTVVLIHGLGDRGARDWARVIPALAPRYHVLTFDLPGFGRSGKPNALYSPANYAAFVDWVVSRYAHAPVIVVGHSMGGAIALQYAADHPAAVERLVLVDVAGILRREQILRHVVTIQAENTLERLFSPLLKGINAASRALASVTQVRGSSDDIANMLATPESRLDSLDGDPAAIASLALIETDFSAVLRRVSPPTLIVWGARDGVAPLRTGKTLHYVLPNARLDVMRAVGHTPMLENPDPFNRLLLDWLAGNAQAPAPPAPVARERIGRCAGRADVEFRGGYDHIEITGCKRVRLIDVSAHSVMITSSHVLIKESRLSGSDVALKVVSAHVRIEGGDIQAGHTALYADSAKVTITGTRLTADTAITLHSSQLDVAGANLRGREAAISTNTPLDVDFSVTRIQAPYGAGYVHGTRRIAPETPM